MSHATATTSDSLIGDLCRAMGALRSRCSRISFDLIRAQDLGLRRRLQAELKELQQRRLVLQDSVQELQQAGLGDSLALAFLEELTRRPLLAPEEGLP